MKKLLLILSLVLLLCFTFSCQKAEEVAEEPAVDIEAEREAIGEAFKVWIGAFDAKDRDGMLSLISDDAVILYGSQLRDKTWIGEFWSHCHYLFSPPSFLIASINGVSTSGEKSSKFLIANASRVRKRCLCLVSGEAR